MTEDKPKKAIKLQIDVPPEKAQGSYSNMTMINHTETEFVFDFIFLQPQTPKARVNNRIVLNPKNAKRLMSMLQKSVEKYESRFGEIQLKQGEKKIESVFH